MLLEEAEIFLVSLLSICLAEMPISSFAASLGSISVVGISVDLGLSSFVESLAMVSRIQGVKVDKLVKMPANGMSIINEHSVNPISNNFNLYLYGSFKDGYQF